MSDYMRRRIHACHVWSYEEEDTCIRLIIWGGGLEVRVSQPKHRVCSRPPTLLRTLLRTLLDLEVRVSQLKHRVCSRRNQFLAHGLISGMYAPREHGRHLRRRLDCRCKRSPHFFLIIKNSGVQELDELKIRKIWRPGDLRTRWDKKNKRMQIDKKKTSVRVPRSRQLLERAMSKNKKKQKILLWRLLLQGPTMETVTWEGLRLKQLWTRWASKKKEQIKY